MKRPPEADPAGSSRFGARRTASVVTLGRATSIGVLAFAALACSPTPPHIVLVSVDSLRADHLGAYGYHAPTSPTFDRLADEGALFRNAVSTTSWTLPAHLALFSGLYDTAHGVVRDDTRLSQNRVTLAEVLHAAGYQTAGFYGGPYLSPEFGVAQGFDAWISCEAPLAREKEGRARHRASHDAITGPRTIEAIERWLESASDQPLFLFVHLWDVHYDYQAPQRYREMFADPGYDGFITGRKIERDRRISPRMEEVDRRQLIALYDSEIRFNDDIVADLLKLLERSGLGDDTLLVFTADHGDEFFEHGRKGHQKQLFEESVRVPLVFHWPGKIEAGREVDELVRLIDVMPTVLALAGLAAPEGIQGRDLSPALRGEPLAPAPALMELHQAGHRTFALRTDDWVVISEREKPATLYDLRTDPRQQRPLGPEDPRYLPALRSLRQEAQRARDYATRHEPVDTSAEVRAETLERLEQLGYVGDDRAPDAPAD